MIKGDRRVDLKEFRKKYNTRPLSFASENDMQSIIGLTPGSVTPFGVLNDQNRKVKVFIEESFFEQSVSDLQKLYPDVNIAAGKRFDGNVTDEEVNNWTNGVK